MSVLEETRLSMSAAAAFASVHRKTIWRWAREGLDGIKLEAVYTGTRFLTSKEAVCRFIEKTTTARGV